MKKRIFTLLIISITIMFILTSGCVNSQNNEISKPSGSQNVYTVPTPVLIPPLIVPNPSPTPTIISNINK